MESTMYANTQSGTDKETAIESSEASSLRKIVQSNEVYLQDKSQNRYSRFHSSETTSSKADSAFGELDRNLEHGNKLSSGIFVTERRTSKSSISDGIDVCDGDSWFVSGNKEFDSLIRLDFRTESVGDNEALKSELLHIFERERMTLEQYFKNRMEELLRSFRNKQQQWEERSRAERAELEDSMAQEKLEMQKNFGKEIAKLTHMFNEERVQLEQYYKQQMKEMKDQLRQEQQELNEKTAKDKLELKEKLETEYQAMLRVAISDTKQIHQKEKASLESDFNKVKFDIEKQHNLELSEAETKLQRQKTELENKFNQEKIRQEKDFREQQQKLEIRLQREKDSRLETERLLEMEKSNSTHGDGLRKQEIESLKLELDKLRFQLDEREKNALEIKKFEENILTKGKDGLPTKLREDFDKLLSQHRAELERSYQSNRESLELNLERRLQTERQKYEEENFRENEKVREEMYREREKSREETKREREEVEGLMKKRFEEEKAQMEERIRKEKDTEIERVRNEQIQYRANIQSQHTEKQFQSMSSTRNQIHDTSVTRSDHLYDGYQYSVRPKSSSSDGDFAPASGRDDILPSEDGSLSHTVSSNRESDHRHQDSSKKDEEDGNSLSRFIPTDNNSPKTSGISTNGDYTNYYSKHKHSESARKHEEESNSFSHLDNITSGKSDDGMSKESMSRNSFYVSVENENSLITEINELRRENEGLKAKIKALEENIELHKTYKAEVKAELERVEKKNSELQQKMNQITNNSFRSDEQLLIDTEMQNGEYERQLKEYFDKVKESERKAQSAERKAWDAEIEIKEWKKRAIQAEEKLQELQNKLRNGIQERKDHNHFHKQRDGLVLRGVTEKDPESKTRSKLHKMSEKDKEKILLAFIKGDIRKVQRSDRRDKRELTQREKEKLLQSVKYLQQQVRELEDNQDILHNHGLLKVGISHEEDDEINGFLNKNFLELHRKLQILEERLQHESETVSSSSKSKYLLEIKELQAQIDKIGRAVNSSGGEGRLDVDILRRIERELVSISQFIKGFLSRDNEAGVECSSQRSGSTSRLMQLELDKQELEFKLKMAKDAMSDYVVRLNEKMTDLETSGNMSESMLDELRTRNRNLKTTIQALEEGQKRSQLQNEQLLRQKSALQEMIGRLCTDGDVTSCASLKPSPVPHGGEDVKLGVSSSYSELNFSRDVECCSY